MTNFNKLFLIALLTLGCGFIALFGKSGFSQPARPQTSQDGRYQLVSAASQLILVDTHTGHMWSKTPVYSPAKKNYEIKWVEDSPFTGKNTPK